MTAVLTTEQLSELSDFSKAVEEKSIVALDNKKDNLSKALSAIVSDIRYWIDQASLGSKTFDEAYEEITYLYVFAEMHLKLDDPAIEDKIGDICIMQDN